MSHAADKTSIYISDSVQSPVNSSSLSFLKPLAERKFHRYRTKKKTVSLSPGAKRWMHKFPCRKLRAAPIGCRMSRHVAVPVSARKLAAQMWRLAANVSDSGGGRCGQIYRLGFQPQRLRRFLELKEGATKLYSCSIRSSIKVFTDKNLANSQQDQLLEARTCIQELKTDRVLLKKKILYLMIKLYEERSLPTRRESQNVHALVKDLNLEKRNCQRLRILNSKLVENLAQVTSSAKEFMLSYEKERKTRIILEEICQELAKKIEQGKAEVEELHREFLKSQDEIQEERKMMQLAEVWREEQVRIKMFDAKLIIEEKFSQMNNLITDLEMFLSASDENLGMIELSEGQVMREAVNTVGRIEDINLPNGIYSTNDSREKVEPMIELDFDEHDQVNSNLSCTMEKRISTLVSISSKKPKNKKLALCKLWKSRLENDDVCRKWR